MIQVEEIRSVAELEKLRSGWDELARRVNASVFLSHGWFVTCAKNLRQSEELRVVVARDGERLVGIAPLMRVKRHVRRLPVLELNFLENPLTPFADFLTEDESATIAILQHLLQEGGFDLLRLSRMLSGSRTRSLVAADLQNRGLAVYERQVGEVVYLPIEGEWEPFYNAKSRKFRMTRRSVANKISRLGTIEVHCASTAEELRQALPSLLHLSSLGWKRSEKRDLLGEDIEQKLLTSLVEWSGDSGKVRIWLMKKDNEPIAAEFHIVDGETVYGIRAQYDPQYFSYSPGRALDYEIVERLFQAGFKLYDMGPGVAEYKRNWTDSTYPTLELNAFAPRIYPRFVARLQYHWIPALKQSSLGKWLAGPAPKAECPTEKTENES